MPVFLVLEDESFILLDLELSVEDAGSSAFSASNVGTALAILRHEIIDVAILDLNLAGGMTCQPVAQELIRLNIPFVLHTAQPNCLEPDLLALSPKIITKPAAGSTVVSGALDLLEKSRARESD